MEVKHEGGRKEKGPRFTIRHRSSAKHTASFPTLITCSLCTMRNAYGLGHLFAKVLLASATGFLLDGYVHSNTTCSFRQLFLQHSYMYMFRLCAHPRNMIRLVQLDHKTTPQFQTMFRITRKSEAGRAVLLRTFHSTTAVVV